MFFTIGAWDTSNVRVKKRSNIKAYRARTPVVTTGACVENKDSFESHFILNNGNDRERQIWNFTFTLPGTRMFLVIISILKNLKSNVRYNIHSSAGYKSRTCTNRYSSVHFRSVPQLAEIASNVWRERSAFAVRRRNRFLRSGHVRRCECEISSRRRI